MTLIIISILQIQKPAMVFLDEPTSGLDSFSAVQLCCVLKRVANAGASVLFTIHQPSSEIFNSFDRLILLHKGRVLFQGSVKDVPSTFATCGYPVPNNFNPADWVVNVAQKYPISDLERAGFFQKDKNEVTPPAVPSKGQNFLGEPLENRLNSMIGKKDMDEPPGLWPQVSLLYRRELTYMYRFPLPLYTRFGFTALLSSLIGMIFYKVGEASPADYFNLTSKFGAMMIMLMLAMLGTAQPALLYFPEERPVFLREYSTDHYSVVSYFASRLLVELMNTGIQILIMTTLIYYMVSFQGSVWIYFGTTYALAMSGTAMAVMLGVIAEGNAKVAQQLLPSLFIPQLLFSGFFVSPILIPKFLQWAQYLCVLTYAVRVLILEEFQNCSENAAEKRGCQSVIDNVRANPDQLMFYWSMLVLYFLVFRTLALLLLRKSATKFY
jgi:ABC-type multidrug transport system permease subunit